MRFRQSRSLWAQILIAVVWAWAMVPRVLQTLLSPKVKASVGLDTTAYDPTAKLSLSVLTVGVFFVCLMIIVLFARDADSTGGLALVAFLSPWVCLVLRDEVLGVRLHKSGLLYLLIAVSVWVLRPRLADLSLLGYLVGVTALISIALGVLVPTRGLLNATDGTTLLADKDIIPGGLLIGPFTDGNNLGQFLIIGLATVTLIKRPGWRTLMLIACVVALVWSASRSSLVALGAVLLAATMVRLARPSGRGTFGATAVAGVALLVVGLPLVTTDPGAFTNRGYIWQQSFTAWRSDPVFGLGANWYSRIASTSSSLGPTVFHGHNQFVQLLVVGGVVLAILTGISLVALTSAADRRATTYGESFGIIFLVGLLGACLLEVSYAIVDRDFLVPVMVLPAVFILFAAAGTPVPTEGIRADDELDAWRARTQTRAIGRATSASPADTRGVHVG